MKTADGLEVDFLARHPGTGDELIQVSADVSSPETRARECGALHAAAKAYPRATLRLLVLDRHAQSRVDDRSIEVQPAYEWMLEAGAGR